MREIGNKFKNIKFIDYSIFLCNKGISPPFKDGESYTPDGQHLYRGSPTLTRKFSKYINQLIMNID